MLGVPRPARTLALEYLPRPYVYGVARESVSAAAHHTLAYATLLPVAAIVDDKIFCVHGGLSPSLRSKQQITEHRRPCDVPDVGLICDFLWADPDACTQGWAESERGVSYTFGADVVSKFLEDHDFDLMVRAHQVVEDGYEFFAQRQLVTLFSAPNYCGEFDNSGAVMSVDASLMCSFHILKPRSAAPGTPDTVGRGAR